MSTTAVPRDMAGRGDIDALLAGIYRRAFPDEVPDPIVEELARVDLFAHLPGMGDSTRIADLPALVRDVCQGKASATETAIGYAPTSMRDELEALALRLGT